MPSTRGPKPACPRSYRRTNSSFPDGEDRPPPLHASRIQSVPCRRPPRSSRSGLSCHAPLAPMQATRDAKPWGVCAYAQIQRLPCRTFHTNTKHLCSTSCLSSDSPRPPTSCRPYLPPDFGQNLLDWRHVPTHGRTPCAQCLSAASGGRRLAISYTVHAKASASSLASARVTGFWMEILGTLTRHSMTCRREMSPICSYNLLEQRFWLTLLDTTSSCSTTRGTDLTTSMISFKTWGTGTATTCSATICEPNSSAISSATPEAASSWNFLTTGGVSFSQRQPRRVSPPRHARSTNQRSFHNRWRTPHSKPTSTDQKLLKTL